MSPANQELVRRLLETCARGDADALVALLDPAVEVRSLLTEAERADYHGHDGARTWLATVREVFPDWRPEPREQRAVGDAMVTALQVTATSAETHVPIDQSFWHAATVVDGKVTWFGFFRTEAEAIEAAQRQG